MWRRYAAIGDSFTAGFGDPTPGLPTRSLTDWLAETLGRLQPGWRYQNLGRNGATAPQVLESQVPAALSFEPDLVSLTVGANDVGKHGWGAGNFEQALSDILGPFHRRRATLLTFTYPDVSPAVAEKGGEVPQEWQAYLHKLKTANQVVRTVSQHLNACILDFESFTQAQERENLSFDRLHPNARGYKLMADRALERLIERFDVPLTGNQ
jgi:lysophospholipase L1-like esterase